MSDKPRNLGDVGREFRLKPDQVEAIASALGHDPTPVSNKISVLTGEQMRQLQPYLERAGSGIARRRATYAVA